MIQKPLPCVLFALLALGGCGGLEPADAALARAKKALYEKQIEGLEQMLARGREQGISRDRIFLGLSEEVFLQVLTATLPKEVVLKDTVRLRLEKAEPYFRYSKAVVVFHGRLSAVDNPRLFISVRLAGGIDKIEFKDGRLSAVVKLYFFEVQDSALGNLSKAMLEGIVRDNMNLVSDVIPPIEIPVSLEQSIAIKGLGDGPVSVKPGTLPFSAAVARVSTMNSRLWIGLDISAGPWKPGGPAASKTADAKPQGPAPTPARATPPRPTPAAPTPTRPAP